MSKVDGWERILRDEIDAARDLPFVWGSHDCATWAGGVRASLRGEEKPLWGKYRSERGAMLWLARRGYSDLEAAGRDILGEPLASPLLAQRGDVVLAVAFGICLGAEVAFVGDDGLYGKPLTEARLAWRT